jgi:WD40 repeat protein
MLYGATGAGKSSLINAGLLPRAVELGFQPERVRVQPRAGEALVVERISTTDDGSEPLPSLLAGADDGSGRVVLSIEDFEQRVRAACAEHRPLLVFDQFEELCTLFETDAAREVRRRVVELLVRLLRAPLPVKLLFVFREDYLGKVKELLAACPELVDQALLLTPLAAEALPTIIRGPFECYPGHFARELDPALAERLRVALAERFGAGDISLSEVQTVCLRLWQATEPDRLLGEKGVQGLLEDYLGEALDAFPLETRFAAVALLGQMVTPAGTRNVVSAEDLVHRVREEDTTLSQPLLEDALDRLDRESRLVRRERRRDLDLYEITSEFLVPWISSRRAEARSQRDRRRDRRRLLVLGSIAAVLLAVVVGVALLWLEVRHERDSVAALALSSAAIAQSEKRIDVPLLLALDAYDIDPASLQARDALTKALVRLRKSRAVAIMHGHRGLVQAVAVSPDGKMIASAGADSTVRLWNARTHRQIGKPLKGHTGVVTDVAFTPDGRRLASASDDGTVVIWDLTSRRHFTLPGEGPEGGINAIAISPDGKLLIAAGYDETVRTWNLASHGEIGKPLELPEEAGALHVAFGPDSRRFVIGTEHGSVQLLEVPRRRIVELLRGGGSHINAVAFSSRGLIAAGSDDGVIHLWNAAAPTQASELPKDEESGISSLAFAPDGRTLASTDWTGAIKLWGVAPTPRLQSEVKPPENGTNEIEDVAFAPGGHMLATANWDGSVRLWAKPPQAAFGPPLSGHKGSVNDVAFSPDTKMVASAGADHKINLWSVKDRRKVGVALTGHTDEVMRLAFSIDGTVLASGSEDGTVRVWNVAKHKATNVLPAADYGGVAAVAFSRDGRWLAFATEEGALRLFDLRTGELRTEPKHESEGFSSLAFSPDSRLIASGGKGGVIRLWNPASGAPAGELIGHTSEVNAVAFAPSDPDLLASASTDETVRLWDLSKHTQVGEPLRDNRGAVYGVAFSPDARLLAGGGANSVVLWDVESRTRLGDPLEAEDGVVEAVAFDSDGTTLASAYEDGKVRLWPGVVWGDDFDALRKDVCHIVGGDLTRQEWTSYAPHIRYHRTCSE